MDKYISGGIIFGGMLAILFIGYIHTRPISTETISFPEEIQAVKVGDTLTISHKNGYEIGYYHGKLQEGETMVICK